MWCLFKIEPLLSSNELPKNLEENWHWMLWIVDFDKAASHNVEVGERMSCWKQFTQCWWRNVLKLSLNLSYKCFILWFESCNHTIKEVGHRREEKKEKKWKMKNFYWNERKSEPIFVVYISVWLGISWMCLQTFWSWNLIIRVLLILQFGCCLQP